MAIRDKQRLKAALSGAVSILVLVLLDQFTKHLAVAHLKGQANIDIIKGVFELEYLENRGAAFGILQNQQWLFILLFAVVVAAVGYAYYRIPLERKYLPLQVLAVLIIAGGLGNLIDRMLQGYVVDFFYFSLINFPVFNVADIYVTVSVFVLFFMILFYYKEEDLEYLMAAIKPASKQRGNIHGN